jgi:hypothetical protein
VNAIDAALPPPPPIGLTPAQGSWLAGCVATDRKVIYTGLVQIQDQAAHLRWQALADRRAAGQRPLEFPYGDGPRTVLASLDAAHPLPAPLAASWLRGPGSSTLLHLDSAPAPVPCSDWHLEPLRQQAQALVGRWLAPEQRPAERSPAAQALFLLDSMELQLEPTGSGLAGRLRGHYLVNRSHPAAAAASASAPPLVELRFAATTFPAAVGDAAALDIPWRSPTLGQGILRIAPLGAGRIAVHWQRDGIPPGRIQLSGGSAILLRRD